MTVKPRRRSVRVSAPPGPREQPRSLPEQPVAPTGHPSSPLPTYEELLVLQREAEDKLADYRALIDDVYQILDWPLQIPPVDPLRQAVSRTPLADRAELIQRHAAAQYLATINAAKRALIAFDRTMTRLGQPQPRPSEDR